MKVVAFNGSPRKDGNTSILLNYVIRELEKEGIETELVPMAGKEIRGCIACYKCIENKNKRCAVEKDMANEWIEKMEGADGILLGSPVYFSDVTADMTALIDRAGFVSRANKRMYRNKVGGALVALRRNGALHAIDTMTHLFFADEMVIAGRAIGVGMEKGEVEKDAEGIQQAKTLGQRMSWLLKKLK